MAAIVLAAGSASRMGKLKQLLPYAGRTFVSHAVQQAVTAGLAPIVVVVGAEADAVRSSVAALPVEIAQNERWQLGMGSSISVGIRQLQETPTYSAGVGILLADQPLVAAEHLQEMRRLLYTGKAPIVAAEYGGTLGVPAFFKRELFGVLADLSPDAGARHLLRDSGFDVTAFPLPEAAMDIDTPADFEALSGAPKSLASTS